MNLRRVSIPAAVIFCCSFPFSATAAAAAKTAEASAAPLTAELLPVAAEIVAVPSLPTLASVSHTASRLLLGPVPASLAKRLYLRRPSSPVSDAPLPPEPGMANTLSPIPVVGTMYRRTGHHFNTADGSSVDAFTMCYRMSDRIGFQVIPGDPAPVKLAVTSLSNNTGVTIGMTLKLSRQR